VRLSRKFKPPPRSDLRQWAKARALVAAGFVFESVRINGVLDAYPDHIDEVRPFAARHADHLAAMRARWPDDYVAIDAALAAS
jgi:hypothetical protein